MKKLTLLFTILVTTIVTSQNFQLHNDFERGHLTTTFELFKMDKYGNTFTFIDFDYNSATGTGLAYFEMARVLKTEKAKPTRKKMSYKLKHELEQLPSKIEALEAEISQLQAVMAGSGFYSQEHALVEKTIAQLGEKEQMLEAAEERWLELEEAAE